MNHMLARLSGGDLRSEGQSAEVAAEVIAEPRLLAGLAEGLRNDDRLIRARTCMAIEIISRDHPALLAPIVSELVDLSSRETVPQERWHLAETLGRVCLSDEQVDRVVTSLLAYLTDKSKIVRYTAVDALGVLGSRSSHRCEIIAAIGGMTGVTKSLDKAVARAIRALGGSDDE